MFENQMNFFKGTGLGGFYAGYAAPYEIYKADQENIERNIKNESSQVDLDEKKLDTPLKALEREVKKSRGEDELSRWQSGELGALNSTEIASKQAANEASATKSKLEQVIGKGHYWIAADQYLGSSAPGDIQAWKEFTKDAEKNGVRLPDNPWSPEARADIQRRAQVAVNNLPMLQKQATMDQEHTQALAQAGYKAGWEGTFLDRRIAATASEGKLDRQSAERIAQARIAAANAGGGGDDPRYPRTLAELEVQDELRLANGKADLPTILRLEHALDREFNKMVLNALPGRLATLRDAASNGDPKAQSDLDKLRQSYGADKRAALAQEKKRLMAGAQAGPPDPRVQPQASQMPGQGPSGWGKARVVGQ